MRINIEDKYLIHYLNEETGLIYNGVDHMTHRQKHDSAFSATLTGILDIFKKSKTVLMPGESDSIKGKTCLITGANRGLGRATAVSLAGLGGHVFLACRSGIPEAGHYVKKKSGSELVETAYIDLADLRCKLCAGDPSVKRWYYTE